MADQKRPGPIGSETNTSKIDVGTSIRHKSRPPGPIGSVDATESAVLVYTSGHETKLTKPSVIAALEQKGLPFATEVVFDLIDSAGKTIISGRFDVVTVDPRTGNLIIPELKGKDLADFTDNQKIYVPMLESANGGVIRIRSSKGGTLGLQSGVVVKIDQDNYVRIGLKNLADFSDALQTIAGGERIKHSFLDKAGKMHLFSSTEAFKAFLESTGRGSLASRVVSKLKGAGPVLSIGGVLLWAGTAEAAENSKPLSEDELRDLKSNLLSRAQSRHCLE